MLRKIQNQINAIDAERHLHGVLVESVRHVTRTARGAVIETGGDRFFLTTTQQLLILDPVTAKLRTEDGQREFTFTLDQLKEDDRYTK